MIEKDTDKKPGGSIKSAYCTCTAGLYGSCNHVAGLLFIVESAVLHGITKPTWIDRLAVWTVPSARTETKPCPVNRLIFKKNHYSTSMSVDRDRQTSNIKGKISFSPLSSEQEEKVKDEDTIRKELYDLLKTRIPKGCFAEFMEERKLNVKVRQPTPKSLAEKANEYQKQDDLSVEDNVTLFTNTFTYEQ